MATKLEVVLTWAERIAAAVSIAVPAIRKVVAVLDTTQSEVILICDDKN